MTNNISQANTTEGGCDVKWEVVFLEVRLHLTIVCTIASFAGNILIILTVCLQQQQQPLLFPFFLLISYMYFTINKRRKGCWRPVITIGLKVPDRQLHSQLAKYGR